MADNKVSWVVEIVDKGSQSLGDIEKQVTSLNKAADNTAASGKKLKGASTEIGSAAATAVTGMERIAETAQIAAGPLGTLGTTMANLSTRAGNLGPILVGTALAFYALQKAITASVAAAAEHEVQMATLEAVIKATGGAAGFTADELDKMAGSLANQSLFTDDSIRSAQALILTFKSIKGDNFETTTRLAADLAAVMGGDVSSAALQLSKALEEPEKGIAALARSGVSFTEAEKEMIKSLNDVGLKAEAQRVILQALEGQVGGAAAGQAAGLTGSVHRLSEEWNNFLEALGNSGALELATRTVQGLTTVVQQLNEAFGSNAAQNGIADIQNQLKGLDQAAKQSTASDDTKQKIENAKQLLQTVADGAQKSEEVLNREAELQKSVLNYKVSALEVEGQIAEAKAKNADADVAYLEANKKMYLEGAANRQAEIDGLKTVTGETVAEYKKRQEAALKAAEDARSSAVTDQQTNELAKAEEEKAKEVAVVVKKGEEDILKVRQAAANESLKAEQTLLKEKFDKGLITFEQFQSESLANQKKLLEDESNELLKKKTELAKKLAEDEAKLTAALKSSSPELTDVQIQAAISGTKDIVALKQEQLLIDAQLDAAQQSVNNGLVIEQDAITKIGEAKTKEAEADAQRAEAEAKRIADKNFQLDQQLASAQQDNTLNAPVADLNTEAFDQQLQARIDSISTKYAALLKGLEEQGRTADINIVNGLIDQESTKAQFDQLQALLDQQIAEFNLKRQALEQSFGPNVSSAEEITLAVQIEEAFIPAKAAIDETTAAMTALAEKSGDPAITAGLEQAKVQVGDLALANEELLPTFDDLVTSMEEVGAQGLSQAFSDVITGTKSAKEAMADFAKDFLAQIAKMIAQQIILNALKTAAFGAAGGGQVGGAAAAGGIFGANGQKYSVGGRVWGRGSATSDSIPALISNGEYVIRAKAVQRYGVGLFERLNRMQLDVDGKGFGVKRITRPKLMRFATGGYVGATSQDKKSAQEAASQRTVQVDVVNVKNEDEARDYMMSQRGQKDFISIVNNNSKQMRNIVSGAV